jgi:hypothetical protein
MPSVLPEVDAGDVAPAALAAAMAPLLDAACWQAAADAVAARAQAYEPAQFRAAVRSAVSDLLPEAT